MPVYRIGIWIAHPDLVVQAETEEEAEGIVSEFFRGTKSGGPSEEEWKELVNAMDVEVEDFEVSDYSTDDMGLTKDSPYKYVKLIPENLKDYKIDINVTLNSENLNELKNNLEKVLEDIVYDGKLRVTDSKGNEV